MKALREHLLLLVVSQIVHQPPLRVPVTTQPKQLVPAKAPRRQRQHVHRDLLRPCFLGLFPVAASLEGGTQERISSPLGMIPEAASQEVDNQERLLSEQDQRQRKLQTATAEV